MRVPLTRDTCPLLKSVIWQVMASSFGEGQRRRYEVVNKNMGSGVRQSYVWVPVLPLPNNSVSGIRLPDLANKYTENLAKCEFQLNYLDIFMPKKSFIVYLNFTFNWASCIWSDNLWHSASNNLPYSQLWDQWSKLYLQKVKLNNVHKCSESSTQ